MAFFRRAAVYLGLADDAAYDEQYEYEYDYSDEDYAEEGAPPERSAPAERAERAEAAPTRERRPGPVVAPARDPRMQESGSVRPITRESPPPRPTVIRTVPATSARVHVVDPHGFNDAQEVGDRLKAEQPVILNLQACDRDLQRRLIDFSSGLTYAVGGSMSRVAEQVFLLTPSNVEVSPEEKERLQARGLYRT